MAENPTFHFSPRWKEELVCSCPLGSFILEMPMGITSVYLPTEEAWQRRAPDWAKPFWETLRAQLEAYCREHGYPLYIDETAAVYQDER
jgi:hypothetical protein